MLSSARFDVLIVYSESLARSADDSCPNMIAPFPKRSRNAFYNTVYGYFLESCQRQHLTAAFTTSAAIIGPGKFSSFWTFKNKTWQKINSPCTSSLIFDKFSPSTPDIKSRRQLLFSRVSVKPFNDPILFDLFFDKQFTYDKLAQFSIPTVSISHNSLLSVNHSLRNLSALLQVHPFAIDFTSDVILKDRFGAGGRHIYKFSKNSPKKILSVLQKNPQVSFILQPFAKFDQGFSYRSHIASTDIRFIYLNGQFISSYIRMAKDGDFRCNQHQGGALTYLGLKDLPPSLIVKSNLIAETLHQKYSLFTLDFLITNSGRAYLLEGNTGPGLNWESSCPRDEFQSKKLIRLVVGQLSLRLKKPVIKKLVTLLPVPEAKILPRYRSPSLPV